MSSKHKKQTHTHECVWGTKKSFFYFNDNSLLLLSLLSIIEIRQNEKQNGVEWKWNRCFMCRITSVSWTSEITRSVLHFISRLFYIIAIISQIMGWAKTTRHETPFKNKQTHKKSLLLLLLLIDLSRCTKSPSPRKKLKKKNHVNSLVG